MYWFITDTGRRTFPSYRRAYEAGLSFGRPQIWFTDADGDHLVGHIAGQEAFGIGT